MSVYFYYYINPSFSQGYKLDLSALWKFLPFSFPHKHTCAISGYADLCEHVQLQRSKWLLEVLSEALKCLLYVPWSSARLGGVASLGFERTEVGQLSQDGECWQNCLDLHSHGAGVVGKKLSFLAVIASKDFPSPHFYSYSSYTYLQLPWSTMQHAGC